MSSAYLRLLIFLPAILIPLLLHPVQHFSWCTLHISWISRVTIYSLDVLFPDLEPVWVIPCPVLTVASWPAYRFLRRQVVVWYSHLLKNFPPFVVILTVKGFGVVNKAKSVSQSSCSVMSDSLQPHGLQHTRLPCLLPTPGACSDSCPSSQWCHPTIPSSVVPFNKAEVDVFLEFSCFFYDPKDVGNLGGLVASPMAGPQPELLILLSGGAWESAPLTVSIPLLIAPY